GGGGGDNNLTAPDISTSANITTTYQTAIPTYTTTNTGGKIAECNTTDDLKNLVLSVVGDNCQITGTANLTVPQSPHEITITAKNATGTSDKTISIVINKADQSTLSITGSAKTSTDSDFTFAVNGGSSTGDIVWSSSDTSVATINTSTGLIDILKAGNTTITATKAGDDNYNSVSDDYSLTINKVNQTTLAITGSAKTATDSDFTFATTGGDGTGALSWVSTDTSIATINSTTGLIHIIKAGNTTIKTTKATDDVYNVSNEASYSLVVSKVNQTTLAITGSAKTSTDADFVFPTTGGDGTGTIIWQSSDSSVASIVDNQIHIIKAGTITITATKQTDDIYNASNDATYSLTINKVNQATLAITGSTKTATDSDFTFATTGGDGTGALSWVSTDTSIATINSTTGLIHIIKAGNTTIETTKATDDKYNISNEATYNLTITPKVADLTLTLKPTKIFEFNWSDIADSGVTSYELMENKDGSSGFVEIATINPGIETYQHIVALYNRVNAKYLIQACVGATCYNSDELSVSGNLKEAIGYIKASNTGADDKFGSSLSMSSDGSTLAVGTPEEDNMAGAVYIFVKDSSHNWTQQAYLKASNAEAGDQFGYSVALSSDGSTLAVGAKTESSNATVINGDDTDNSATGSGAVYVFTRDGTTWTQQSYLKASNTDAGDEFGHSVSLSSDGSTLAVGAPREDSNWSPSNNAIPNAGAVYIFTRDGADWSSHPYIKTSVDVSDVEMDDLFGWSVSISGDGSTLAVGLVGARDGFYIFVKDSGNVWSLQDHFSGSAGGIGWSVSLSGDGNTLAIGAPFNNSNSTGINTYDSNSHATRSGLVYVFIRLDESWFAAGCLQATIKASNTGAYDNFGWSVSLSADGDTLAVGAYREASNATGINGDQTDNFADYTGAVYVFTRDGTTWSQQAYIKASNTEAGDNFGNFVSLSGDGNTIAVSATGEASNATGINGNQTNNSASESGAVYLY
ncbi:MAG: hypothetical protein DRQ51_06515, partial [Gammaproteobacteria bacterium]